MCVNKTETTYGRSEVNENVEWGSTFTFTHGFSHIVSILFTHIKPVTVRRTLPWPPNKLFYKLANQDTWNCKSPTGKWRNNKLLKTHHFVFYEQGGGYLLEDSAALYTCNINVIGLYISTITKIVMWISCWYRRHTRGYGNFCLFHR